VADSADTLTAVTAGQERAVEAADKAIALGGNLPDGYLARGFVRVPIQWDFEGARADLQRALSLKPDDPDVLSTYAQVVLRPLGRKEGSRAGVAGAGAGPARRRVRQRQDRSAAARPARRSAVHRASRPDAYAAGLKGRRARALTALRADP